jgi:hypothetical protein
MTNKTNSEVKFQRIEVFVVIKDGAAHYYLLKVERRDFDVYCFLPKLGLHHSLHHSGESHFRYEEETAITREEPPVALVMGEAGTPIKSGIKSSSINGLGRASGICTAILSIASLSHDFRKFNRSADETFVIDRGLFLKDTRAIQVGVWAVPDRNKASFEFNNPNIHENLLYKVAQCEPQIWIYARPFA